VATEAEVSQVLLLLLEREMQLSSIALQLEL
jgi:hypothetical protein